MGINWGVKFLDFWNRVVQGDKDAVELDLQSKREFWLNIRFVVGYQDRIDAKLDRGK